MMETMMQVKDFEKRGTFVGTLNYIAPEMIQSNTASLASDIWSVGCLFYKMLTGQILF